MSNRTFIIINLNWTQLLRIEKFKIQSELNSVCSVWILTFCISRSLDHKSIFKTICNKWAFQFALLLIPCLWKKRRHGLKPICENGALIIKVIMLISIIITLQMIYLWRRRTWISTNLRKRCTAMNNSRWRRRLGQQLSRGWVPGTWVRMYHLCYGRTLHKTSLAASIRACGGHHLC